MQVLVEKGGHPPGLREKIGQQRLDLYHEPATLDLIYDDWWSVLITEGDHAFASCFGRRPIGDTGLYDVEPVMGYAGLLTNTADPAFLARALDAYSDACRELKVVAELVRFNPLLQDHVPFEGQARVTVIAAKPVVTLPCFETPADQMRPFTKRKSYRVRRTWGDYTVRKLDKAAESGLFRRIYEPAMIRLGADPRWLFGDAFYHGLAANPAFTMLGVWSEGELMAACLFGCHPGGAHYVISGNAEAYALGAAERMILEAAMECARNGCGQLILGGGVTAVEDDGLLVFKASLSRDRRIFHIGKMVHDESNYRTLCGTAIAAKPTLANSRQLLLYRDA